MEIENTHITRITLPMELSSANQAEEYVRRFGEKCDLKGKILFRLVFVVNEVVTSVSQLSKILNEKGNIEIMVEAYTRHIVVNITFPDSIPLDPSFNHSDELLGEFPGLKLHPDIFWHHAILKWVDKATWSRSWKWKKRTISLEQYTRSGGDAGELYFLSLSPKVADGLELSSLQNDVTIAKTPGMETALCLGPQEVFVLKSIDGKTPIREIYYSFVRKFGLIHPQTLGIMIEELINRGLIIPDRKLSDIHRGESKIKSIFSKIFKLRYSIPNSDRLIGVVNQKIGWLWSIKANYFYLFFVLGSVILFSFNFSLIRILAIKYFTQSLLLNPGVWIGFYLGMNINIVVHEFSHAIVCKRLGGKVNELGIMFYYALLCPFADTTDAWMFKNKWHRVMVSLAGPLSTLVLGCIFGWGWLLCMYWHLQTLSLVFGAVFIACLFSAFVNLIPFLETDGYYILMDILELPGLRKKSFSYFLSMMRALFSLRLKPKVPRREAVIYTVFSIFALVSVIFILFIILHFIQKILTHHPGIFSWLLAAILVVLFFERVIKAGLLWYKRKYLALIDLKTGAGK